MQRNHFPELFKIRFYGEVDDVEDFHTCFIMAPTVEEAIKILRLELDQEAVIDYVKHPTVYFAPSCFEEWKPSEETPS